VSYQAKSYHDSNSNGNLPLENNFSAVNSNGHRDPGDFTQDLTTSTKLTQTPFVQIPGYFFKYWTLIIGLKASRLWEIILLHCYDENDTSFVSKEHLAEMIGVHRHTLTSRWIQKTDKEGKPTGERYWQEGHLDILVRHGLMTMRRRGKSYKYEPIKVLPTLTKEQVLSLPLFLQEWHQEDIERAKELAAKRAEKEAKEREKEQRKQAKRQKRNMATISGDMATISGDMATISGDMYTAECHESYFNQNLNITPSEREVVGNKSQEMAGVKEETDYGAIVHSFYENNGEKVSNGKVASEVNKIKSLRQEYTDNQIIFVIESLANNQQDKKIRSLGSYLPFVIGQVLEEAGKTHQQLEHKEKNLKRLKDMEEQSKERETLEAEEYMQNPAKSKIAMAVLKTLNIPAPIIQQQAA